MSFSNVVGGKLKLKGKALDVKGGGVKKKKSKRKESFEQKEEQQEQLLEEQKTDELIAGEGEEIRASDLNAEEDSFQRGGRRGDDGAEHRGEDGGNSQQPGTYEDHRTPAEKVYDEQKTRLEMKRLAKVASKSHRQKIEEFNQYLANLSEHYDIPKVGPG